MPSIHDGPQTYHYWYPLNAVIPIVASWTLLVSDYRIPVPLSYCLKQLQVLSSFNSPSYNNVSLQYYNKVTNNSFMIELNVMLRIFIVMGIWRSEYAIF